MEQRLIDANKLNFDKLYQYFETDNDYDYACCKVEDADTVLTIPENPTNGDMIKAMFSNVEVREKNNGYEIYFGIGTAIQFFNYQWWNAPYKVESED